MVNNVGTVSETLSRTIGDTTTITDASSITTISGYADIGFIVFDNDGTMGICTSFTRDESDNPIYMFRTCSLNTQIDITTTLQQKY